MNAENRVEFDGSVHGTGAWLTYGRGQQGRVNFWLAVSRECAGDGFDVLHCAVEPKSGPELLRLERELRPGRRVRIAAVARSLVNPEARLDAQPPGVIFIAEECGLDGEELRSAHRIGAPRRERPAGKAAAAHDYEDGAAGAGAELELQEAGR